EPIKEDEPSPEEVQAATIIEEEGVSQSGSKGITAPLGDVESDQEDVDTDSKKTGDNLNVTEDTLESENKVLQDVSVKEQGGEGETVDSENGSKKCEEDEKMEDKTADSASTSKESTSVEGDQTKRFVAFCLLETQMVISVALAPFTFFKKCLRRLLVFLLLDGSGAAASSRNLWVSGLSSSTRATDLKTLFSKYGKVVGAKVVTNAKSPGARCYGFVTMSTTEEATECISHLHRTELHGRMISVERAKNEPAVIICSKSRDRSSSSKETKDILSFNQIMEHRERERQRQRDREVREVERRVEKQRLDADRMEHQFLEREMLRIDYERRREQERILREREELRRQQELLRLEQDRRSLKRPYDIDHRKDDWVEKRMAVDDRYSRSDLGRQDRYHDFDQRDRSRYQDDVDRRDHRDRDGQACASNAAVSLRPLPLNQRSQSGWGFVTFNLQVDAWRHTCKTFNVLH
uniref:Scaffold attachment factor B n=1 Tax=Neogobius melanostomus TaxID=47308 RepID=A0A8C6WL78_9GOBI